MFKCIAAFGAALLACGVGMSANAQFATASTHTQGSQTFGEFEDDLLRTLESKAAPIQTSADLGAYLSSNDPSPLDRLPPVARAEFVESLRFGSKGLHTLNGSLLERHLTPTETHDVLALFGLSELVFSFDNVRKPSTLDRSIGLVRGQRDANRRRLKGGVDAQSSFGGCDDCPQVIENAYCDGKATCRNCDNCQATCVVANCTYNEDIDGI